MEHATFSTSCISARTLPSKGGSVRDAMVTKPNRALAFRGGDIHKFTHGLALAAERLGVHTLYGQDVQSVQSDGNKAIVVTTSQDNASDNASENASGKEQSFDGIVVCAGVASRNLAAQLGDRVNIYPVKGYSITVNLNDEQSRAGAPSVSLLDDETKLVTSRLGADRLRVAGTAEFNGVDYHICADRIAPLINWVAQCFPNIDTRSVVPWAGLRPMMPNMLPRVGRGRAANGFYDTGHGHLSWTLSAITADMVGDVVLQASK